MVGSAGLRLPLSAELADAVDLWIEWPRSERRYSPHTQSGYRRDLDSFLDFQKFAKFVGYLRSQLEDLPPTPNLERLFKFFKDENRVDESIPKFDTNVLAELNLDYVKTALMRFRDEDGQRFLYLDDLTKLNLDTLNELNPDDPGNLKNQDF